MSKGKTVPFRKKDVKEYLDRCIVFWRKKRDKFPIDDWVNRDYPSHYIDAFQSVRMSLFGELLEKEKR